MLVFSLLVLALLMWILCGGVRTRILILLGSDGDMGLPLIVPILMVVIGTLKSSLMHLQISKLFPIWV